MTTTTLYNVYRINTRITHMHFCDHLVNLIHL